MFLEGFALKNNELNTYQEKYLDIHVKVTFDSGTENSNLAVKYQKLFSQKFHQRQASRASS
jgi:hypothetical protein